MTTPMEVVVGALDALKLRDWEGFARRLHPEVVHRTPGVPDPVLGRDAFVMLSRQAVDRSPDVSFEVERLVTEGETVVVIGEWTYTGPGLADFPCLEYLGLAI